MAVSTTLVQWSIQQAKTAGLSVPSARLEVDFFLRSKLPGLQLLCEQAWIDTGAPLSVIPFHVHNGRLDWKQVPGVQLTWGGQVCDLGAVEVWLSIQESPNLRGPLNLLAKFPRSDPPGSRVPILVGLEFFLSNQAGLNVQPPAQQSAIWLP